MSQPIWSGTGIYLHVTAVAVAANEASESDQISINFLSDGTKLIMGTVLQGRRIC